MEPRPNILLGLLGALLMDFESQLIHNLLNPRDLLVLARDLSLLFFQSCANKG